MTPSVASVQRLAFFSLRIPDSELGCDVGSARDPIKRGVARLRSVTFSSSSMHNRDEILVAKGRRRAGDGDGPDSPGRLTKNRTLAQPPHQNSHSALAVPPSTWWYRAALASLIAKGVVLKAPVLVDAIAVDLVLGYAYAARVEDRDARMRVPIGVRLEHPLVRVSVHKGCPRR